MVQTVWGLGYELVVDVAGADLEQILTGTYKGTEFGTAPDI